MPCSPCYCIGRFREVSGPTGKSGPGILPVLPGELPPRLPLPTSGINYLFPADKDHLGMCCWIALAQQSESFCFISLGESFSGARAGRLSPKLESDPPRLVAINNFRNGRGRSGGWARRRAKPISPWILASPTTPPRPIPALSWRGMPGIVLFLAPYRAMKDLRVARAAHCPTWRGHHFWKVFLATSLVAQPKGRKVIT